MKRLLVAIAAIAVLMFSANYYYARQAEKHLDTLVQVMNRMGAFFNYSGVTVTLGGSVRIDDIILSVPGLEDTLYIDRAVLRTGSVFGVHKLVMDSRNQRIPAQLGVSVEGMRVPLRGESYRQMSALGAAGDKLTVAGCGDRTHFSADDLAAMGYGDSLMMDSHMDFRLVNDGGWFEVEVRTQAEDMHEVVAKLDVSLNAASRDAADVGIAMVNGSLHEVALDYFDRGYVSRVLKFCQQEAGLSRQEFLARHLEAWQEAWNRQELVAGESMVAAYRQFLEQPEHFGISARPAADMTMMGLQSLDPELMLYQFQTRLTVNQAAAGRMDLTVMDEATRRERRAAGGEHVVLVENRTPPVATQPSATRKSGRSQVVAMDSLAGHLNDLVILRLTSGRTLEGRIRRLDHDALQLHSYQSGGSVTVPVAFKQIAEVRLK